ncbi:MAG TPA: glycosyltransferase [Alphaproteobacteria bacterium]|nr:glycosyltransferase [Alphaproteobacteria bacterium]
MPSNVFDIILLSSCALSLGVWIYLFLFHHFFWLKLTIPSIDSGISFANKKVVAIVPARNEGDVIFQTLHSLLQQQGQLLEKIIVINDNSDDNTAAEIDRLMLEDNQQKILLIQGKPLTKGWTGKLWAIQQGFEKLRQIYPNYDANFFVWLTDADIVHQPVCLSRLMQIATQQNKDMVSLMVKLSCKTFWEKLLIPPFVYFFQKLYPFRAVNSKTSAVAAAAGGCILIRRKILEDIGGISSIRNQLIDDCALAKQVKKINGQLWLGLTNDSMAVRPYKNLSSIWKMVVRSAYRQLNYSWIFLMLTTFGLIVTYIFPWCLLLIAIFFSSWVVFGLSLLIIAIMTITFIPTARLYHLTPLWFFLLSFSAFLYMLMTINSAYLHRRGRGGNWKGRLQADV